MILYHYTCRLNNKKSVPTRTKVWLKQFYSIKLCSNKYKNWWSPCYLRCAVILSTRAWNVCNSSKIKQLAMLQHNKDAKLSRYFSIFGYCPTMQVLATHLRRAQGLDIGVVQNDPFPGQVVKIRGVHLGLPPTDIVPTLKVITFIKHFNFPHYIDAYIDIDNRLWHHHQALRSPPPFSSCSD